MRYAVPIMQNSPLKWVEDKIFHVSGAGTKLVLLYLCLCADHFWTVDVNIQSLKTLTGLSESTIKRALADLENDGFIERSNKGNQHRASNWTIIPSDDVQGSKRPVHHTMQGSKRPVQNVKGSKRPVQNGLDSARVREIKKDKDIKIVKENKKENVVQENRKEWVESLLRDKLERITPEECTESWINAIERNYGKLDLVHEAESCIEWLNTATKGKQRKSVKLVFVNWLKRALEDQQTGKVRPTFNPHSDNLAEILKFAKNKT